MKPLLPVAVAAALVLCAAPALAQSLPPANAQAANAQAPATVNTPPLSANEAAGLPDLAAINRPPAEAQAKVELNTPRTPSFHERSGNGTEITEFRDRGKPVEIDVHSNFGTRYQMSPPIDQSPTVRNNGQASTRLPSVNLHY